MTVQKYFDQMEMELAELFSEEYERSGGDLDFCCLARVAIEYLRQKKTNDWS